MGDRNPWHPEAARGAVLYGAIPQGAVLDVVDGRKWSSMAGRRSDHVGGTPMANFGGIFRLTGWHPSHGWEASVGPAKRSGGANKSPTASLSRTSDAVGQPQGQIKLLRFFL